MKLPWNRRDVVDEEIRSHLDMAVRERMERGETREQAEAAARRQFGNVLTVAEVTREIDGFAWLARLAQDLRYGVRLLLKNPAFSLAAILSLAVGIGATTAIFRIIDAVRLRSLPVSRPEELARIRLDHTTGARGNFHTAYHALSNPVFEELRRQQQGFTDVAAWTPSGFNLATGGEMRPARGMLVTGSLFEVLGVKPALGRLITTADDHRGCAAVAVISHAFWNREFGGDRGAVGKTLSVDGHPTEIVGVTPPDFFGLEVGRSFDVALPSCADATVLGGTRLTSAVDWWQIIIGRLKPGWTHERATAQLRAVSPAIFRATLSPTYPSVSVKQYLALTLHSAPGEAGESLLREHYNTPLVILVAAAALVLLIACANVANLLLARATAREREIAIRLGLGASRARVVRQLLTESALLSACGAAGGILLADAMSTALVAFFSTTNDSVVLALRTDARVLAFATGLGIVTCLLFGLTPALRATRTRAAGSLKIAGRGLVGGDRGGLRRTLVVAQVALSLVLVAGGILFARTLANLRDFDTGFRRDGILLAGVDMRRLELPTERRLDKQLEILDRVRSIPGVRAASTANIVPLSGSAAGNDVTVDGTDTKAFAQFNRVMPDYFKTLEIPLLEGRDFTNRDTMQAPMVAIVDQTFVDSQLGGGPAVGRRIRVEPTPSNPETTLEIVGVVKNSVYQDLREERTPTVYLSALQTHRPFAGMRLLIQAGMPPSAMAPAVTRTLVEIDPRLSFAFRSLDQQIEDTVVRERLLALLANFFAAVAALLAVLGLYGVIAYGVARRTNEIGVRMALGASERNVLSMVVKEAVVLVAAGIAVGVILSRGASRLAGTLLFGVEPNDPLTLAAAAAALLTMGLAAAYWPARAATRIEPTTALRAD